MNEVLDTAFIVKLNYVGLKWYDMHIKFSFYANWNGINLLKLKITQNIVYQQKLRGW